MNAPRTKHEIFFVIGSLNVGGAEMHLSTLSRALTRRGHDVTIYNITGDGPLSDGLSGSGVKLINPPVGARHDQLKLQRLYAGILSAAKLCNILRLEKPGIVHFFLPQAYIIGAVMARCAGLSRLVMSRRSLNNYQDKHPLLGRIEHRLHRSMRLILGNSEKVVEQLHDAEQVPREKLGLIYNGIDLERFDVPLDADRKRQVLDIPSDAVVMTIVANLIPYKGHSDLLSALATTARDLPDHWRLLIVGRDDGIGDALAVQAGELGFGDKVHFLGMRDDVPDLLRISDIGLLCSHEEGFANAILEGMAAGLPMIVTDVGGNAEAVIDGTTGFVVSARSPSELGSAIVRLVNDEQLRKRFGRAGRKRVEILFSLEQCVAKYEETYSRLMAE